MMELETLLSKRTTLFKRQYEIVEQFHDFYIVEPNKDELKTLKNINKMYLDISEQILDIEDFIYERIF